MPTYLERLLCAEGFLVLSESPPLIRLAVTSISTGRTGAKLPRFKNNYLFLRPFVKARFGD